MSNTPGFGYLSTGPLHITADACTPAMNYRIKHEKFAQSIAGAAKETLVDSLAAIEYCLQTQNGDELKFLVPREANFQLPNVFLRTRMDPGAEKLLAQHACRADWDSSIDALVEQLDEIEFEDGAPEDSEIEGREELLESLIRVHSGGYAGGAKQ
ncbi:hypothetical protein PAPHI01_1793 [Pancytospora philotis]|nr:hypothetical protein PAPHI01_1793 [Pancytospora philotis]